MAEKKILIAYGTRYGSAAVVAADITEMMKAQGAHVDTVNLRKEKVSCDLNTYDLVIAGSSVAMFSWVGKVKRFLRRCRAAEVRTAVYITCGTAIEDEAKARAKFLDKVIAKNGINPVLAQPIAPVIDFRPGQGVSEGLKNRIKGTIQGMAKEKYEENGLMDFRDPERFAAFLEKLKTLL